MATDALSIDRENQNNAIGLTPARTLKLVLFATFVWFCAAMFIRFAGPTGTLTGIRAIILYALTIPGTIVLNRRARLIVGMPKDQMVTVIAVTSATATMLDGVAMSQFPQLYGPDPVIMGAGAAWLLWAIGVAGALSLATVASAKPNP